MFSEMIQRVQKHDEYIKFINNKIHAVIVINSDTLCLSYLILLIKYNAIIKRNSQMIIKCRLSINVDSVT